MTYCVATLLDTGMVFLSDSRTNAGVDHINTFRKMHVFERPGDRVLVLRVNQNGARSFAAAVAIPGKTAAPRAGLAAAVTCFGAPADSPAAAALRSLLEAEARQRPVFHGMTAGGTTYSGFEAQATADIVQAAAAIVPPGAPACHAALVFAGDAIELPRGLVVGLLAAPL